MAPQPEVRIGERLRFYRQAKGKTQAVVAGLAGVTEDYLSQIERGLKTPTLPLVHRFSKILGVRVSELLGESATEHDERVHPVGLRGTACAHVVCRGGGRAGPGELARAGERGVVDLARVAAPVHGSVGSTSRSDHRCAGGTAGLAGSSSADARREGHRISADLFFLLRTFTKRIGRTDLSLLVADRGVQAAEAVDEPVWMAAAKWNLGHILLAQGEADGAEEVAMTAIEDLQRDTAGR